MRKARPTPPATMDETFAEFKTLYDETILRIASWSEGDVLEPQYMHLHENDIGTEGGYELGRYLVAFVDSLGSLAERLSRVVFCYSYEVTDPHTQVCSPENCTHEYFYSYQVLVPHDRACEKSDIRWTGGNVRSKPSVLDHHQPLRALPEVLSGCHWIQPYMLRKVNGKVDALFELARWTGDLVPTYCHWHSQIGGYQFSIYGYEVKGETLSDAEQILLNIAFLVHIWTWNHDLRTAHLVRRLATENLPRGRELWAQLNTEMEALLDRLSDLHISRDQHLTSLIALPDEAVEELFADPHDLSDWRPQSFGAFLKRAHSSGSSHRSLREFLGYCGWPDARTNTLATPAAITTARGCWLATKYLTRCALDTKGESYRKLSFDQTVLAALIGLHRAEAVGVPVCVIRSIEVGAAKQRLDARDGLVALNLAYEEDEHNWVCQEIELNLDAIGAEVTRATAKWSTSGTTGGYLPSFLQSGMLAMQMVRPRLHVFPIPRRVGAGAQLPASSLLLDIARVVRALAKQAREPGPLVNLTGICAELRTRKDADGKWRHRARLRLSLDSVLPPQATIGRGELSGPLTKLAEWCGACAPVRVDGEVDSDFWNCFVVTQGQCSEVLLTFEEGTAT